jgi:hypothetical protein
MCTMQQKVYIPPLRDCSKKAICKNDCEEDKQASWDTTTLYHISDDGNLQLPPNSVSDTDRELFHLTLLSIVTILQQQ